MKNTIYLALLFFLSLCSCLDNDKKSESAQNSAAKELLFRNAGNAYWLKKQNTKNGNEVFSVLINDKKFGPEILLDSTGELLEKRLFWADSLCLSKKFYRTDGHVDSIQFYKYTKIGKNKYEATLSMSCTDPQSPFFEITFPVFACKEQIVKLRHYNFDVTRIFLNLHREAQISDYSNQYVITMKRNVRDVVLLNSDVKEIANTFAVDFANATSTTDVFNIWSVLLIHPTIIVNCDSLQENQKLKILDQQFVF